MYSFYDKDSQVAQACICVLSLYWLISHMEKTRFLASLWTANSRWMVQNTFLGPFPPSAHYSLLWIFGTQDTEPPSLWGGETILLSCLALSLCLGFENTNSAVDWNSRHWQFSLNRSQSARMAPSTENWCLPDEFWFVLDSDQDEWKNRDNLSLWSSLSYSRGLLICV